MIQILIKASVLVSPLSSLYKDKKMAEVMSDLLASHVSMEDCRYHDTKFYQEM